MIARFFPVGAICTLLLLCCAVPSSAQEGSQTYGGEFRAGLWYSSDDGPQGSVTLLRENILASDADLRFGLEGSAYKAGLMAGLTIPSVFGAALSQDIVLHSYVSRTRPELADDVAYRGAELSSLFGKDFGNGLTLRAGPGYQIIHVDPAGALPVALSQYLAVNGTTARGGYGSVHVALDRAEAVDRPQRGYRLFAGAEAGQLGDTSYSKLTFSGDAYGRIGDALSIHAKARVGRGYAAGGKALPLFKNFTNAGMSDLRGFAAGGLGPTSAIPGTARLSHVGGDTAFFGSIEMAHPLRSDDSLHVLGFVDIGSISDGSDPFAQMRQSVGLGLEWHSPIGPLQVALSKPVRRQVTDKTETLQVAFGLDF
jgi:outer membrane protein insertion porin family